MTDITVQTVLGRIPVGDLGMTLTHEHLWANFDNYVWDPPEPWKQDLLDLPASSEIAWALREDPFFHPDNCRLDSVESAVEELDLFKNAGGRTVMEVSNPGMGRGPDQLVEISKKSGLNVVMGCGWYIGPTHPESMKAATSEDLAQELLAEFRDGVGVNRVRPGLIGEIGVSTQVQPTERKALEASAIAALEVGVPVLVHLDGWVRTGHEVLDILERVGLPATAVVLGHMNPSGADFKYQSSLAERGAWLGFDMTGMGFYYADHGGQAPSPEEDAAAVAALMKAGFQDRLLISQDVFIKSMWTRNGGNGYAYVPRLFLPRLTRRFGIDPADALSLLTENPRELFVCAKQVTKE